MNENIPGSLEIMQYLEPEKYENNSETKLVHVMQCPFPEMQIELRLKVYIFNNTEYLEAIVITWP